MWILIEGARGGYKAHSFHKDEATALEWKRCLEYGGADVTVCFVGKDILSDIAATVEKETT